MVKNYIKENVYDMTQSRLKYLFDEFEQVVVAFSGGKDSGVLLNLAYEYAKSNDLLNKLKMYHLDYEAQYQMTTDYVEYEFNRLTDIDKFWLCLPIKAQCSTSMFQNYWTPWNAEEKDIWVRNMPTHESVINTDNVKFDYDDWDYTVQDNFGKWISKDNHTVILIGNRADESLQRQSSITSKQKVNQYKGSNYITKRNNHAIAYPIYDWIVDDIWVANAKFGWKYNELYDVYYQAGVSIHEMRVASPFNDYAQDSLKLYKAIEPHTWSKMVSRVNGVNFTGIYGGTTVMGWKNIIKPDHFTWKEYMYFLLDTLPEHTKEHYLKKLEVSKKSWVTGGARDEELISQLEAEGAPVIRTGRMSNRGKRDKEIIQFEDYLDDTTVDDFKLVPTYKRMCICIMKNDTTCKYMGFSQTKEEIRKRKEAMEKYDNIL